MKTKQVNIVLISVILLFTQSTALQAQFLKKLSKRVGDAAEETIYRKAEEKTEEETSAAFDSLFNNTADPGVSTSGNAPDHNTAGHNTPGEESSSPGSANPVKTTNEESLENDLMVYRKFDFIPGDRILLFDDFTMDNIGDFPSKWDTNGSGELVEFSQTGEHWFRLVNNSIYIPLLPNDLPKEYTIEFDMVTEGLDRNTTSSARVYVQLDEEKSFQNGRNHGLVSLPFALYVDAGVEVKNVIEGKRIIYNNLKADIRKDLDDKMHVSIAVNNQRFRLWVNERKIVDVPRLLPADKITCLKIHAIYLKEGKESVYLNNIKVAEGGLDLRHQLISEGQFTTSGILFDVNSASIKPESYGIIKSIAQVLQENPDIRVLVVGHTDADGDENSNLILSQKRAESIKNFLMTEFLIEGSRIEIDGKGEQEPVESNSTTTGKAKNRRVEFIKI